MVNKGRIYKEVGNFQAIIQIWSNRILNWDEKLGILVDLKRRLQDKPMKSKNTQFGWVFA